MKTSTTSIKVMEDCSTVAFVQAFTRFACEIEEDEVSQLVKGCESMRPSQISGTNYTKTQ